MRFIKDPRTGQRVSRPNPSASLVIEDVPDLRIVSDELWTRVRDRQLSIRHATPTDVAERPFWDKQRPRYLVTGIAKCGVCGASYVKISTNPFGCAAARYRGTCGNRLNSAMTC